jgi:hypothetical protein
MKNLCTRYTQTGDWRREAGGGSRIFFPLTMAPITVSSIEFHSFSRKITCPFFPATLYLQAVKAQKVALAFSHIKALRSWGAKHYTMKSCANAVGPLPQPKSAYVLSRTLVLQPQLAGQSKYAFKPLSSPLKRFAFVRVIAAGPASDGARQERAKAHAGWEKRSKGISGPKSEHRAFEVLPIRTSK